MNGSEPRWYYLVDKSESHLNSEPAIDHRENDSPEVVAVANSWYQHGKIHRNDEPAIMHCSQDKG